MKAFEETVIKSASVFTSRAGQYDRYNINTSISDLGRRFYNYDGKVL